jgi:hypothetical protein
MIIIYLIIRILIDSMINQLPEKLRVEIIEYCRLNEIQDVDSFIIKMIRQSFTTEKYGSVPNIFKDEIKKETVPEVEVKEEKPIVEENIKNDYELNLNLKKETKPIQKSNIDDIYGEGY